MKVLANSTSRYRKHREFHRDPYWGTLQLNPKRFILRHFTINTSKVERTFKLRRTKMGRSTFPKHIHQKFTCMWNRSCRTTSEWWQKTPDLKKKKARQSPQNECVIFFKCSWLLNVAFTISLGVLFFMLCGLWSLDAILWGWVWTPWVLNHNQVQGFGNQRTLDPME